VTGVVPSVGVTLVAEMVAVELVGAPEEVSWTVCLKPPAGVMVMVVVAVELRATVAVAGERLMEKSAGTTAVMVIGRPVEVEEVNGAVPP
jgi:hypothetical protein